MNYSLIVVQIFMFFTTWTFVSKNRTKTAENFFF